MKSSKFPAIKGLIAAPPSAFGAEFFVLFPAPVVRVEDGYACLDVCGPLMQHAGMFCSYEALRTRAAGALADIAVHTLILKINSPGGEFAGSLEFAKELRAMAKSANKRLVAFIDNQALSAAYAIACAADEIVVTPSAFVGSIGVWATLADQTALDKSMGLNIEVISSGAAKAERNPHVPISDEARLRLQDEVDAMARLFFEAVSDLRFIAEERIVGFQGAQFFGEQARKLGLVDRVALSLEDYLSSVRETVMGAYEDVRANTRKGLAKLAAEDSDDGKKARRALAQMDKEDEKEARAEEKESEKAEGDEDKPEAKAEADDEKKEARAQASGASIPTPHAEDPTFALARATAALQAEVKELRGIIAADRAASERAALLAQRPDFPSEVRAVLASAPIETVKKAVREFPRPATNDVVGSAAALTPSPTRGSSDAQEGSPEGNSVFVGEETLNQFLDRKMGMSKQNNGVVSERRSLSLGFLNPSEAKAAAARISQEGK